LTRSKALDVSFEMVYFPPKSLEWFSRSGGSKNLAQEFAQPVSEVDSRPVVFNGTTTYLPRLLPYLSHQCRHVAIVKPAAIGACQLLPLKTATAIISLRRQSTHGEVISLSCSYLCLDV
jgi:hypothetical protein